MNINFRIMILGFWFIFLVTPVLGKANGPESCSEIEDDSLRLSCFDSFFKKINPPTDESLIKNKVTKKKISKSKDISEKESNKAVVNNSNFGLQKLPEDLKNNNYVLTSIVRNTKTKNNKIIFTMDNGQRWIADSSYRSRNLFKPQTRIKIEPASLSGFQMIAIEKNQKVRIKRLK